MGIKPNIFCQFCGSEIPAGSYFCPNCGKQVKQKPLDTSLLKKVIIYSVSLFLPPFGLWYAVKYIREGGYESRKIAIISIILTVVSTALTIWVTAAFLNSIFQSVNQISNLNY